MPSITREVKAGKPFKIVLDGKDAYFQLDVREILVPDLENNPAKPLQTSKISAGKVYLLRNITEFQERDEAKTNFIATISHELKTPISAMKLSLKLLTDKRVGELNPEQEQLVRHIEGDSERLLKITHELLDLSQVETGNIQLNFVPARPEQIVDYALKTIQFEAGQKAVSIEKIIAPALPSIQVDVEKTAWVLINFLSNTLRYSSSRSKIIVQIVQKEKMIEFLEKALKPCIRSDCLTAFFRYQHTRKTSQALVWAWLFPKNLSWPRAAKLV